MTQYQSNRIDNDSKYLVTNKHFAFHCIKKSVYIDVRFHFSTGDDLHTSHF